MSSKSPTSLTHLQARTIGAAGLVAQGTGGQPDAMPYRVLDVAEISDASAGAAAEHPAAAEQNPAQPKPSAREKILQLHARLRASSIAAATCLGLLAGDVRLPVCITAASLCRSLFRCAVAFDISARRHQHLATHNLARLFMHH